MGRDFDAFRLEMLAELHQLEVRLSEKIDRHGIALTDHESRIRAFESA
jgi:hypothetical protein